MQFLPLRLSREREQPKRGPVRGPGRDPGVRPSAHGCAVGGPIETTEVSRLPVTILVTGRRPWGKMVLVTFVALAYPALATLVRPCTSATTKAPRVWATDREVGS